jgi:prepilin-type N-terminal cleavage/methylation domain-containing protein
LNEHRTLNSFTTKIQSVERLRKTRAAFTLIEMLCVCAIISILMALYAPAIMRAYLRVRGMAQEWEAPQISEMFRSEVRRYCEANRHFVFNSKADFENKCHFSPKCRDWVELATAQFVPFDSTTPTNTVVFSVAIGRKQSLHYVFRKSDLAASKP